MQKLIQCAKVLAAAWLLAAAHQASAGGSAENVLLIIDPTSPESMYVGNYYRQARNIPDRNVLYMLPSAPNYQTFVQDNLPGLFGSLANQQIAGNVDYVIVASGNRFYVDAPGLVGDSCSPVNRFSLSSAYTMAFISQAILAGGMRSSEPNRFYRSADDVVGFDSETYYYQGLPSNNGSARRYFIGAQLGYSGERGNTPEETIAMIARDVAVDGTRPGGTFYYMKTTDGARNVRSPQFQAAVNSIKALGGSAEIIDGILPLGKHDALGIMTGWATPGIEGADMTIKPGAICDHLTSYAATFDVGDQEKISSWIRKGAGGSWGEVEEPCNYTGKFPHARVHVFYYQGASLGEALLRSVSFTPFQGLLYGDPLTRPFAYIPSVSVPDFPTQPVLGTVTMSPAASTADPNAAIAQLDVMVDGLLYQILLPGQKLTLDTTGLTDGAHELRFVAYDNTVLRSVGSWSGMLNVSNKGQSCSLSASPSTGDLATAFNFSLSSNPLAAELRLIQNGRVIATAPTSGGVVRLYGLNNGAGPAIVQAEALLANGRTIRSNPVSLNVAYSEIGPAKTSPVSFSYTKYVRVDQPAVVELPAAYDDRSTLPVFTVLTPPSQATIQTDQSAGYRIVWPNPGASGVDSFTYKVSNANGVSSVATVTLIYTGPPIVTPISYSVRRGTYQSGNLADLFASDDSRLVVQQRPGISASDPNVQVIVEGTSNIPVPSTMLFTAELSSSGTPSSKLQQRVELFNFQTQAYEVISQRNPTTSDSKVEVFVDGVVSRFVETVTRRVRARISFFDQGAISPAWVARFDQVVWQMDPP